MITVRISAGAVSCEGHSGYAPAGSDIVCAAVTSAMRYLAALLDDTLSLSPEIDIDDARAYLRIACAKPEAMPAFRAFALLMREYAAEYPKFLRVFEN